MSFATAHEDCILLPGLVPAGALQQEPYSNLGLGAWFLRRLRQGLLGVLASLTPCGQPNSIRRPARRTLHTGEQPSPDSRFPSSHCSSPSTMPLPHSVSQRTTCSRPRSNLYKGLDFAARAQFWRLASHTSCMQTDPSLVSSQGAKSRARCAEVFARPLLT
jgi:hypothetical protein